MFPATLFGFSCDYKAVGAIPPLKVFGMNRADVQTELIPFNVSFDILARHALTPEQMTGGERETIVVHLRPCNTCSEACNRIVQAETDYVRKVREEFAIDTSHILTEQGIGDPWHPIVAYEAEQGRPQRRMPIYHIGRFATAVAACIPLALTRTWQLASANLSPLEWEACFERLWRLRRSGEPL